MSNISLYKLTGEYIQAQEKLADLDLPENVVEDTLEGLKGELEAKATNVAAFVMNMEALADNIKAAEEKLAARRKSIENRADRIRAYLKYNMEKAEISEISSPEFRIVLRQNPPKVEMDDGWQALLPGEFKVQQPPPPPTPDKKMIAAAIKDGIEVPGARLVYSKRVEIK